MRAPPVLPTGHRALALVPALAPFVRAFRAQQDLTLTEEKLTNTLDGHGVLQAELSTAPKEAVKEAVAQAAADMNQEHQVRQEFRLKRQFELDQEEAAWRQQREAALVQQVKDETGM